jgi:hypothetical protein
MSGDRLEVSVSFDERRGYIATAPGLRQPVTALSLGGLRRRIEIAMLPDDLHVVLHPDRAARRERNRRRQQPQLARRAPVSRRATMAPRGYIGRSGQLGSDREKHRAPAAGSPRRGG